MNLWIEVSWIGELTIVVLTIEVGSDGVGNSEEVPHQEVVADVGIEVVLEVLEHVQVILNESVFSDSWEGEGLII